MINTREKFVLFELRSMKPDSQAMMTCPGRD